MLSIIDTNCSREPTVSAKTGCVDLVFEDDETAIAVRDAIAAERRDMAEMSGLISELEGEATEEYIDLIQHRSDMCDLQFCLGRLDAFYAAISRCGRRLGLQEGPAGAEEDA